MVMRAAKFLIQGHPITEVLLMAHASWGYSVSDS